MLTPKSFRRHSPRKTYGGSHHSHGFSRKVKRIVHRWDRRKVRQALREGLEDVPPPCRFPWKFYY